MHMMKGGMKSFIKNNFEKPYLEIEDEKNILEFNLKKGLPLSKHFLIIKHRKTGKRICKEIKSSKVQLTFGEIEEFGEFGVYDILLKVKSVGKTLLFSCPFVEEDESKYILDKENTLLLKSFETKSSTLAFELKDNFDEIVSKYRRDEALNENIKDAILEHLGKIDEDSINITKVYGRDISEIIYNKPKDQSDYEYKLSSIVLVYNGEEFLRPCLDSLVNQTLDGLEIILMNDKSTDCSLDICKEYATKYDNVRIIDKQDNHGLATSANMGIQIARGEYVILVDNDDIIPKDAYKKLYDKAKETDADISTGKANFIVETWQQEMKDYEKNVWDEERVVNAKDYTEIFNEAFYWNKIMRKEMLIDNDIYLPVETKVYADRKYVHQAFCCAETISIIPDCVYLWRRVIDADKESLSMRRKEAWNYIDRIDSYEKNLEFYTDFHHDYMKNLMRRVIYPIEGILGNEEFEDVFFERGGALLKRECPKIENLYDNDLTGLENLYLYLTLNDKREEIKEILESDINYREMHDEDDISYWNMPLFRNEEVNVPDDVFKVRSLMSQFINIDKIATDDDYIIFENIRLPKHLEMEKCEMCLMERVSVEDILEENYLSYELEESEDKNVFNLKIAIDDLNLFQIYDLHLKAYYSDKKPNKIRIDENCIKEIENNTDKVNIYATRNRQNISITSNLFDEFKFELSADDEGMKLVNKSKTALKRELPIFIKDLNSDNQVKFMLDSNKDIDEIKWKHMPDEKTEYGLYLSSFKNGKVKRSIPLNVNYLSDFDDIEIKKNLRIFKDDDGNIKIKNG